MIAIYTELELPFNWILQTQKVLLIKAIKQLHVHVIILRSNFYHLTISFLEFNACTPEVMREGGEVLIIAIKPRNQHQKSVCRKCNILHRTFPLRLETCPKISAPCRILQKEMPVFPRPRNRPTHKWALCKLFEYF